MRVSSIQVHTRNYNIQKRNNLQKSTNPAFQGDTGRAIGATIGAVGAIGVAMGAAAIGITLGVPALVLAGVAAKACGDEGSRIEDENKRSKP